MKPNFTLVYLQIGNAVAPPMAAAIGQEIRKSIVQKFQRDNDERSKVDTKPENVETDEKLEVLKKDEASITTTD